MQIRINNGDLKKVNNFLGGIALKRQASRGKVKLNQRVAEKLQEFSLDFEEVRKSDVTEEERNEQLIQLIREESIIDMGEYPHLMTALHEGLKEYDEFLEEGRDVAYDSILDALERAQGSSKEPQKEEDEDTQYQEVD